MTFITRLRRIETLRGGKTSLSRTNWQGLNELFASFERIIN